MVISTTKCGHCNKKWSSTVNEVKDGFGPPKVKCLYCGGLNRTNMNWSRDMTKKEVRDLWLSMCWRNGVVYTLIMALLICSVVINEPSPENLWFLLGLAAPVLHALYLRLRLIDAADREKKYLENYDLNGFMTSEEFTDAFH